MAKTAKEYENEYYTAGKARIDPQYQQRKQTDQQTIADIDATLTKATQAAADKYQQQIDAAPGEYQPQYDRNALSEALGRERAEMKMANMGMTNSGLSETSQAALSVQRGRADAAVSKSMREYVSGLETAISDAWAKKESDLADETMRINKATDDWYTGVMSQLASDAQTAGAQAYAADREAEATAEAARIKAQQEAEEKRLGRLHEINLKLLDGGATVDDLNLDVYGVRPEAADRPAASSAETALATVAKNLNKTTYTGGSNWWANNNHREAEWYVTKSVETLQNESWYQSADIETKGYAAAIAAGRSMKNHSGNYYDKSKNWLSKETHKEGYIRGLSSKFGGVYLAAALSAAGLGTVQEALDNGWITKSNAYEDYARI